MDRAGPVVQAVLVGVVSEHDRVGERRAAVLLERAAVDHQGGSRFTGRRNAGR